MRELQSSETGLLINEQQHQQQLAKQNNKMVIICLMSLLVVVANTFVHSAALNGSDKFAVLPLDSTNGLYVGEIAIGSPAQKFRMIINTASIETWLYKRAGYKQTESSTYKKDGRQYNITYGNSALLSGRISIDTFNIAGLIIRDQKFVEVEEGDDDILQQFDCDGVLGIGSVQKIGQPVDYLGAFDMMVAQNLLPRAVLSLHLYKDVNRSPAGELIFGGTDERFYEGSIEYTEKDNRWNDLAELNGVCLDWSSATLDKPSHTINGPKIAVDSTTNLMTGNALSAENINKAIGATQFLQYKIYALPECVGEVLKGLPEIRFELKSQTFSLTPDDYIIKKELMGDTVCISAIKGANEYAWRVGNVFLRKYYSVFDMENNRLGFARSVDP